MFRTRNIFALIATVCCLFWSVNVFPAPKNALAIFNLRPTNIEAMGYNGDILYALISALERDKAVELMPRREMEEILFHAGLVQGDDPEQVQKIGRILNINYVLFGNVTKQGEEIRASLKLMDIEKGSVIGTWSPRFSGRKAILSGITSIINELSDAIHGRGRAVESTSAIPPPPQLEIKDLKIKSKGKTVTLSWQADPSQPITGYHIYRSGTSEGPFQYHGKTAQKIYHDTTTRKGRSYFYRIGIIHHSGKEVRSPQILQVKNVGKKTPHPPLILGARGYIRKGTLKIVPSLLNENQNFKIRKYKIFRRTTAGGRWETIQTIDAAIISQSDLFFSVEDKQDLKDGETYTYAVSSVDDKELESPMSDPVTLKTVKRPTLTVGEENLLRKIVLIWQPLAGVEGYYLYRRADQDAWGKVGAITGAAKYQMDDNEGLEDGRYYQYYLTAYDDQGETGPSKKVRARTKNLPDHPQDLLLQSGLLKSVRIIWTPLKDPDVGGYIIYRGANRKDLKRITKIEGHTADSLLDKGSTFSSLEDGKEYYYTVAGYNLFGASGKMTSPATARTKPLPEDIKGLMVTAAGNAITIQWQQNPEPDIRTYLLFKNRNNGFWSTAKEIGADQTRYIDTDLKPEAKYRYKIIAEDKDGLKSNPVETDFILSPIIKTGR